MKRFFWLGFVVSLYLICTGCGDTFRPIIIPNPPVFPNPKAAHTVVAINDNAPLQGQFEVAAGTAMVVDVSGDTDESVANVGLAPVHAVQQTANQVLVVNHSVTGALGDSITKLSFSSVVIGGTATITLPPDSAPNFVATTESNQAYVSMPGLVPPSVAIVNTLSNTVVNTVPVGNNPDAIAETQNGQKLYVANEGDNTVSAFNVVPQSLTSRPLTGTFDHPLWIISRNDSQRLYVLNGNGVVSTIDDSTSAGPDTVIDTSITVPGAKSMTYDLNLNRMYIPGAGQLVILDVSQSIPVLLKSIPIPQVPSLPTPVNASAVAVTALPDGSRVYVGSAAAAQSSQVDISAVQGDGTTATYTYIWTGGHDLTPGISVAVSGMPMANASFDGTYTITAVAGSACNQPASSCTFQASNTTVLSPGVPVTAVAVSTTDYIYPMVTVIDVASNNVKTTIGLPFFPDATNPSSLYYVPICASTRFRFNMAAGGDSSRAYLSSCDQGAVDIIDTATDSYVLNLSAPVGTRTPIPPDPLNPPQNPVFLIAGP
jgi:hypothetical protein